ncbi:MAG TPA: peptidoglycan-binding domain-containing protein [Solirubrobacterales bacterium]|nr:peptidoglycan-binding domain-containing protein [Solirubrobacterales bacterium]
MADVRIGTAGRVRRGLAAVAARRALLAAATTMALLVAGVLVLLFAGSGGAGDEDAAAAPAAGGLTGTVERRTLAERLTATGTIGYAGETTVLARLSGTVTALPAVGDVIRRGGRLYALAGEPVLLMYGTVPAYRTLVEGVTEGKDVEQLERNLAALGYEPGAVDEAFTATTAEAVRAWQEAHGLEASGEVELGRVAFLPGPQRVTGLEATPGEALGGGGGGNAEGEGGSEPPSTPVLRTSSTHRVVVVGLEADQQSIAHRGQKVEVVLPDGAEVPGEVRRLAAVEPSAVEGEAGEEPEAAVEATISVTGGRRIPALDGAAVNVLFTRQVRRHVLSVPLTALIAIGGERFAVDVREGGARRPIVVTPGLAADGFVEVEGKGLRAGMTVETGR